VVDHLPRQAEPTGRLARPDPDVGLVAAR
jgi:hypothetical protein